MTSPARSPRRLREWQGRVMLSLYPPLFFQRVRCASIGPGFRSCRMVVPKSLLTRNLNGTTFGGTIFSAADPVYALLYWQIFAREGLAVQVWLKSARALYLRPAASRLALDFTLGDAEVDEARAALFRDGRFVRTYRTEARSGSGEVCALLDTEVYIRLPRGAQRGVSGF